MTQEEFDALPVHTMRFGCEATIVEGKTVRRMVVDPSVFIGVLYHAPDDPMGITDEKGNRWLIGRTPDGVLVKRCVERRCL